MSQFGIQHPDNPELWAHYGWDHALDYFVEVSEGGLVRHEYDARHPGYAHAAGALAVLVDHGFVTRDELDAAASAIGFLLVEEIESPVTRRAAEVLVQLQRAGDS